MGTVRLSAPRPYYLCGELDTCGERSAAEILAQIMFDCGRCLSSGLAVQRLRDVVDQGGTPDEVFEGPAMRHGYVTASESGETARSVSVSELIGAIQRIEGVRRVRTLTLLDASGQPCTEVLCDSAQGTYPSLPFPGDDASIELLRLQPEQGIEYGVGEQLLPSAPAWRARNRAVYDEGRFEFHKLHFERHAFRIEESTSASSYALPSGRHRDLRDYYSIQNEFPEVYGINQYGLPHAASPERRAQARQLKAYLYPFEQLMANFLQNVQDVPMLFSARPNQPARTYHSQYLGAASIAQIEELYALGPGAMPDALLRVAATQDNYTERKGRIYDYLLALYGEAFPQAVLRRFTHYHSDAAEAWLLERKRRLIVALVALGAGRGRGFNCLGDSGGAASVSPLQQRVGILLGFDDHARSLRPSWAGEPLTLIKPAAGEGEMDDGAIDDAMDDRLLPVPPLPHAEGGEPLAPVLLMPADAFDETMFGHGAVLSNYRLSLNGGETRLYCRGARRWVALGAYADALEAARAAHASVASLVALNRQCEGMHLVEHILLRARGAPGANGSGVPAVFFVSRISVVLPRWTLRCTDSDFRNFVEETIREHCPAHLYASFLWLAPALMAQFESLHGTWEQALRRGHTAGDALEEASLALVGFLREHQTDPA